MLLAKSSVFQIEMQLLKDVRQKVLLIEWRDKVEDLAEKYSYQQKEVLNTDHFYLIFEIIFIFLIEMQR